MNGMQSRSLKMKSFFVTGTDTDIGKTFVCSLLVYAFSKKARTCYYKPIQSGIPGDQDQIIHFIKNDLNEPGGIFPVEKSTSSFISDIKTQEQINPSLFSHHHPAEILKSTYCLKNPLSPWQSSQLENVNIEVNKIINDFEKRPGEVCIVEGAGGLEVPINENQKIKDLIFALQLPVLLVTTTKLGTINHTLLSIQSLKATGVDCLGLILNEFPDQATKRSYSEQTQDHLKKNHESSQKKLHKENYNQDPKENQSLWLKNFFEKETGLPVLFTLPCFEKPIKKKVGDFLKTDKNFNSFIENCINQEDFSKKSFHIKSTLTNIFLWKTGK